jgi:prepilin-type processing-associated H-X9-DG protein
LVLRAFLYTADYDDTMVSNGGVWNGKTINNGSWYWIFHFSTYVKSKPANFTLNKDSFFVSPNAPSINCQFLDESNSNPRVTFAEAQGWDRAWGLTRTTNPANGRNAFSYFATYGINEHLCDEMPNMTGWERPAESFFILESRDSEIEGDELDELYSRTQTCTPGGPFSTEYAPANNGGHAGGTSIAFLDGHVKWRKTDWGNPQNQCATVTRINPDGTSGAAVFLNFPPSTTGGPSVRTLGWSPFVQ